MKKISTLIIGVLILSIFLAGCKKDENTPKSQFTYDGIEYELSQGVMENFGQWGNNMNYNMEIVLLSSGFTTHESNGEIDSLSGTGHGIIFDLFTTDANKPAVGDYNYDAQGTGQAGTFAYGDAVINWNTQTETGTEFEINGGKLTVVQSGDTYELNFSCTTDTGKTITGYYKGSLKYYDLSDKKASKVGLRENHRW